MSSPYLIAIAGPSCSGKTLLARQLAGHYENGRLTVLAMDRYYRDLGHMTPEDRAARNFDHPDAVDWSLLHRHLEQLAAGRAVRTPAYDFATHTRRPGFGEVVEPGRMAFVEGIFALYDPAIRALCDVRLYVNAGHACCLARRLARDQRERRRTPAFIERQFRETVAPMAEAYVWPSRTHADAIIPGELDPEAALRQAVAVIEGLRSGRPPAARPGGTPRSGGGRSHP